LTYGLFSITLIVLKSKSSNQLKMDGGLRMALYRYQAFMEHSDDQAFDSLQEPGTPAPWPGIYRCHACGHEIGIAQGHVLPSQNHHQHLPGKGAIRWRLVVSHKKY
jgi:hypothetical protein